MHSSRSNDRVKFTAYMIAKKKQDELFDTFYQRKTWRNWRFRIHSAIKSSEDRFLDRMQATYGKDCTIYRVDRSRRDQMKGWDPSPTLGLSTLLRKRFKVTEVDKYRTSITCNGCMGELECY